MHSTESDGALEPEEAIARYRDAGYDFVSLTDHRVTTDVSRFSTDGFLLIPGMELDCVDPERDIGYHIIGIGIEPFSQDETTRKGPGQVLIDHIREHGGEAILGHPYWLGQDVSDLAAVKGALGLEVYNTTCARPGKAYSSVHWDNMLDRGHRLLGFANDDTHNYKQDYQGGWIMVKSPELTQGAILEALREGRFYSTQGPAIIDIHDEGDELHVHTSPVKAIHFISNRGRGRTVLAEGDERLTSATWSKPARGYVRIEVIDDEGKWAWSQPLFLG